MLFAKSPDPDISGHLILEQFQAQVSLSDELDGIIFALSVENSSVKRDKKISW